MSDRESRRTHVRVAAAVLATLIAAAAVFTYLGYTAAFTSTDEVTVMSPRAGLVMEQDAKVKYRGILIGKVTNIEYAGDQAKLTLSIDSNQLRYIPSNAGVRIAGNTIFGAKSVEFNPPDSPSGSSLRPGATVQAAAVQLEVNTLFQTLTDVLHKIDPVHLNATLSALGEGLRGNGDNPGATLAGLNSLLAQVNPKLPTLQDDLRKTATVANIYADAAPDLVTVFDNAPKLISDHRQPAGQLERDAAGGHRAGQQRLRHAGAGRGRLHRSDQPGPRAVEGDRRLLAGVRLHSGGHGGSDRHLRPDHRWRAARPVRIVELPSWRARLHLSGEPADRQRLRRAQLPWPARPAEQATRWHAGTTRHSWSPTTRTCPTSRTPRSSSTRPRHCSSCSTAPSRNGTTTDVGQPDHGQGRRLHGRRCCWWPRVWWWCSASSGSRRAHTYHAQFETASRLKSGQDVRIAGVPVGSVKEVKLAPDNTVDVTFDVNDRYQLYTSTRAVDPLREPGRRSVPGDHLGPGRTAQAPAGRHDRTSQTEPALDLDALLGGLRPVLKGLDGNKVNEVSNAVIELLQGQGGALSQLLASTSTFTTDLAARDQLIGDVINNLNSVLATVDEKGTQFNAAVDQLQQLITGLAQGSDPIAGAIAPLASAESDLTDMLANGRRPVQGVIENLRPLASTSTTQGRR